MPSITITKEAHNLIRRSAILPFEDTSVPGEIPNELTIPIGEDVLERLEKAKLEGETYSDTIFRILSPIN